MASPKLESLSTEDLHKKRKSLGSLMVVLGSLFGLIFAVTLIYLFTREGGGSPSTLLVSTLGGGIVVLAGIVSINSSKKQIADELKKRAES